MAHAAAALFLIYAAGPVSAAVPGNVRFTGAYASSATLAWSFGGDPMAQRPLMVLSSAADFSTVLSSAQGELGAETTGYYGLTPNSTCFFKVKVSTDSDAFYSLPVSTITDPVPPSSPEVAGVFLSSLAVTWSGNGNAAGTYYYAEAAQDEGFTAAVVSTLTAGGGFVFEDLVRNTTYYIRAWTVGFSGVESAQASFGSTVTLSAPPLSPGYSAVYATAAALSWSGNGNDPDTSYGVQVSSDGFQSVLYSSTAVGPSFTAYGLVPASTYYFRVSALNSAGMSSGYAVFDATSTRAIVPKLHPTSTFPGGESDPADRVNVRWDKNGNPTWTEYFIGVSTAPTFTGYDFGPGAWSQWTSLVTVTSLNSGVTFYFQVKARDTLGRETAWLNLSSRTTSSGPDTVPPAVEDYENDQDRWAGSSSGLYDVDFTDVLGSGLAKFQVKLSTSQALAGTPLIDWTDAVVLSSQQEYRDNWPLPAAAFQTITEGVTAYVSVRVYDTAPTPNFTVSTDVFQVNRDTTPPVITNNSVSPSGWLLAAPGAFDVDFADARSGLDTIAYSASVLAGAADASVIPWTDIDSLVSSRTYAADWNVAFASLTGGATNYISVRAVDRAGNATTLADAFRIMKAAGSPGVSVISPSSGTFISTASLIYGSATGGNDGISVSTVEVRIQALASGKYYDGSSGDFTAVSPVWLKASGAESWTLSIATFGLVNLSSYAASARAYDSLGRYSLNYSTSIFTLDQDLPSVLLSSPPALSAVYTLDAVSGTAADSGAGPDLASVSVRREVDGKWWNFSTRAWGTAQVSSAAPVSAGNWTFVPDAYLRGEILHGATYFVTASASDLAVPANSSGFGSAGSSFTYVDNVPPGQITAVSASSGALPGRIKVSWTASGDDGPDVTLGTGRFAIKYSTYTGFSYSTASAQVLQTTASVAPGSPQSYLVYNTDMFSSTTYYLRLWVMDDAGLWSAASPEFSGMSGESLPDEIAGHVKTALGAGITGVMVEGYSSLGGVWSGFTLDDGNGSFRLTNLSAGVYRIQVTWTAEGISSSVSKDLIPVGYADTDFTLSVGYALASVSGTLSASGRGRRASSSVSSVPEVELFQNGRRIASVGVQPDGSFRIGNILPGTYELRAPGMRSIPLTVRSGENLVVRPEDSALLGESLYAYPNPARTRVTFRLQTGEPTVKEEISVFDPAGRLVRRMRGGDSGWERPTPYLHLVSWDFTGSEPASGVYLYKASMKLEGTGETVVRTGKFAVVR